MEPFIVQTVNVYSRQSEFLVEYSSIVKSFTDITGIDKPRVRCPLAQRDQWMATMHKYRKLPIEFVLHTAGSSTLRII